MNDFGLTEQEIEIEKLKLQVATLALENNNLRRSLEDIGHSLCSEYEDFILSINDDMDVQLGEIYRNKLNNVFDTMMRNFDIEFVR